MNSGKPLAIGGPRRFLFLLALLVLLIPFCISASTPALWQPLGKMHLLPTNELATLKVIERSRETAFGEIKFHVSNGNIYLLKARLHMSDGKVIRVSIQKNVMAGLETRTFPIPAHGRGIKRVEVYYRIKDKRPVDMSILGQPPRKQTGY